MIEVLKNLAKLLAVAVLAGILGALGGYLINSFTDKPKSPAATTLPRPETTRPAVPSTDEVAASEEERTEAKETAPKEEAATEESGEKAPTKDSAKQAEPQAAETTTLPPPPPPPTTQAPAPEPKPADKAKEEDKTDQAPKQDQAEQAKETAKEEQTEPAPKPEPKGPDKTAPEKEQPAPAEDKADQTADKPAPPPVKGSGENRGKDEKSDSFEEVVESQKEKVLLVKSVSASTVDQTVVLRVALDRSAEPKFSRLVGKGKLRVILDFENAVRIKGRVPDVIESPSPEVTGIRIGSHPDKLRIVVDLDPKKTYSMNQHLFSRAYVLEIKPQ